MIGAQLPPMVGEILANPAPSDGGDFTPVTVSPGLGGFLAMFILAVAIVLLVLDMTRRTRRVKARAQVRERMEAEQAEREAAGREAGDAAAGEAATNGAVDPHGTGDTDGADGSGGVDGERDVDESAQGSTLENADDVVQPPADPEESTPADGGDDAPGRNDLR